MLLPWEWWLGDGAYIAEPQIVSLYRKPVGGALLPYQQVVNDIISHYRARVEHINHLIESHAIFKEAFCGGVDLLSDAFFVVVHTTNIHLCACPRYPSFGNWSHFM